MEARVPNSTEDDSQPNAIDLLERRVKDASQQWRATLEEQKAVWAAIEKDIETLPDEKARDLLAGMVSGYVSELQTARSELREHWNADVALITKDTSIEYGIRLFADDPSFPSKEDADRWVYLLSEAFCDLHILFCFFMAAGNGEDTQAVCAAFRKAFEEMPIIYDGIAQGSKVLAPLPEQRERANVSAAGFADTRIRVYGRIRDALQDTSKLQELPAATYRAWAARQSGEPITGENSTVGRIALLLADLGSPPWEVSGLETEAFEAREEARWQRRVPRIEERLTLKQIRARAGLAPREAQALDLELQDYPQDEIATQMGVAEGTVKALLFRARVKLKQAANLE